MKNFWENKMRHFRLLVTLSSVFLFACQGTPPEAQEQQEGIETCQIESSEGCVDEDRGFNPCRINDSLPVCKK